MSRILFVTWDGGGNVPPALGLAGALEARGHDVAFLGHPQQAEAIPFPFHPYVRGRALAATDEVGLPGHLRLFADRGVGADALALPADLLVIDCTLFGAMDAVRRAGKRYVVLEHFYDGYLRGPYLKGPVGLGLRLSGRRPVRALAAAEACLAATLAELDDRSAAGVLHTGPMATGTPAAPSTPTVLVSLSSCNYPGQQGVYQRVLDAVAGLDARVIVTTGPMRYDLLVPEDVEVRGFVPHAELLPQVSLVVGHGGHATTMAALAHDLPLLVLPVHPLLDQPMVGKSVEAAGAGRCLSRRTKPPALRRAIEMLLDGGPHRAAAARLGAVIRAARGSSAGADAVEAVLA